MKNILFDSQKISIFVNCIMADVAQLVECQIVALVVAGSSPVVRPKFPSSK